MIRLLQDFVTRQAEFRPLARAVVGEERSLSYQGLDTLANQIAHRLHAHGCGRGDRVALLMAHEPMAVAALLGVLKTGAIYVPLDPADSEERIRSALQTAEPTVVLTGAETSPELVSPYRALTLSDVRSAPGVWPSTTGRDPGDPALLLVTSGEAPRAVTLSHENVLPFAQWAVRHFRLDTRSRLLGDAPLSLDLSVLHVYATFASGGELHFAPEAADASPSRTVHLLRERKLTHWFPTPSVLEEIAEADALPPEGLPQLQGLAWWGGAPSRRALHYWMERLPGARFTHLYGRAEATVASASYDLPRPLPEEWEETPLGRGCAGDEVLVLDDKMNPVDVGETGRIYIRGEGVGIGYWGDELQTRTSFLSDPFSDDPAARIYRTGDIGWRDADGILHLVGSEEPSSDWLGASEERTAGDRVGDRVERDADRLLGERPRDGLARKTVPAYPGRAERARR